MGEDENEGDDENMKNRENRLTYATPFHTQVSVLLERTWRTIWREKVVIDFTMDFCDCIVALYERYFYFTTQMLTQVRFTTHIVFGIFFGLMYQKIGNDAAFTLNNAGMLYFNLIFIVFTSVMPTVVTCKYRFYVILSFPQKIFTNAFFFNLNSSVGEESANSRAFE